jgi:antitoxin ParD1/3/4
MTVSLAPDLEEIVKTKVNSGQYGSANEVIREGLLLLREQDYLDDHELSDLKREIDRGIDQADRGMTKPFNPDDLKRRLHEHFSGRTDRTRLPHE